MERESKERIETMFVKSNSKADLKNICGLG